MNGKREPVTPEPDLHLLGHARYHPDLSRAFGNLSVKRLGCIFFDIEKHLQQLLTVTPECWNRNVIVPDKRESLRKLSQNDLPDPLQHFVDVDVRKRPPRAVRGEQPVNEILQPVRLADDDSGVLTELRIRELPFEELRRAPDSAERVLDFVSEVPEHLTAGFREPYLLRLILRDQHGSKIRHFHQNAAGSRETADRHTDLPAFCRIARAEHFSPLGEGWLPPDGIRQKTLGPAAG